MFHSFAGRGTNDQGLGNLAQCTPAAPCGRGTWKPSACAPSGHGLRVVSGATAACEGRSRAREPRPLASQAWVLSSVCVCPLGRAGGHSPWCVLAICVPGFLGHVCGQVPSCGWRGLLIPASPRAKYGGTCPAGCWVRHKAAAASWGRGWQVVDETAGWQVACPRDLPGTRGVFLCSWHPQGKGTLGCGTC